MTEKEIRDIVKDVLRGQLTDTPKKSEVKSIAKDEAEKALKKISNDTLTQKDVKDMIKKTMHAYHKWMWEKKGMWIDQI